MVKRAHKNLDVWKEAVSLATLVYRITEGFPKSEIYGITSQMRRAAVSIPSNIAEGAARFSVKEFLQFLSIAGGSLSELDTQVEIARQLTFIINDDLLKVESQIQSVSRLLAGLISNVRKKL
jgi:four helix bundle protein